MLGVKGATRGERRGQDLKGAVDHLYGYVTIKFDMPTQFLLDCRILYNDMKLFFRLG
jgi:hypothetical protein